ncbi:MAG: transcriptional regulator, GntR family [Acidimicrobiaceae bacterium]|jgi:GntR family transcriptional regulator|nr:transcriptional regulator, GntR family [Acidimicrobiaceae bacterium]
MASTSPQAVAPLERDSPVPLWAQLRDDLRRRADAGEFAGAFPSEVALVEQYAVSRNTVRDALRRLRADGVVVAGRGRRPRLGVEVEIAQPLGALYSLYQSVEAAGLEPRSIVRVLEMRVDIEAAGHLELAESTPLVCLERLRLAGGEPLAIDRAWFPAAIAEPLLAVDFTHIGFYDELASRTGIRLTGGREHLRAVVPSRSERALLGLGPGTAAFAIERLGFVRDRPVEWRQTLVRGDRFSVVAEFSAGAGYRLDVSPQPST